ncbi:hypothetical protein [Halomonas casei]|uniref:hypothetical protein n=1 Tax=Halomonas casei TaxID=2742613 RepID=UPI003CE672E9
MLTTTKAAEAREATARVEGRQEYIASLEAWHKRLNDQQAALTASFDVNSVHGWIINVWDDYPEGGTTFTYVEMRDVPDFICFDVLMHLLAYARGNSRITETGVNLSLRFHDSSSVYPALIGNPTGEYSLFKRWEMTIASVSYEHLDQVVAELQKTPMYQGKPFDVISES